MPGALEVLQKNESLSNSKTRFLYFVNRGLLLSLMGKYEESNNYFEKAYLFGEDHQINYFHEAAGYFTNPNMSVYRGEDHEHLMLLYFKAINFLKMQRPEEALVECRRLNIRLQQLSDKYNPGKKYQRDAFIHNLMGIIYQSRGDYNNAFVAYRNALEIYEQDYIANWDAVLNDFRQTADARRNHRHLAGHGFQRRQTERLLFRRQQQDVRGGKVIDYSRLFANKRAVLVNLETTRTMFCVGSLAAVSHHQQPRLDSFFQNAREEHDAV